MCSRQGRSLKAVNSYPPETLSSNQSEEETPLPVKQPTINTESAINITQSQYIVFSLLLH